MIVVGIFEVRMVDWEVDESSLSVSVPVLGVAISSPPTRITGLKPWCEHWFVVIHDNILKRSIIRISTNWNARRTKLSVKTDHPIIMNSPHTMFCFSNQNDMRHDGESRC